jgi:hypothetical protein
MSNGLARETLRVEVVSEPHRDRIELAIRAVIHIISFGLAGEGPESSVVVFKKEDGQPVLSLDWGSQYQEALQASAVIDEDLRTLSLEAFCEKYGIHLEKPNT